MVDHHTSTQDTTREGEALTPEAGRDIERPRGGPKGPLLAFLLLALLVAVGYVASTIVF